MRTSTTKDLLSPFGDLATTCMVLRGLMSLFKSGKSKTSSPVKPRDCQVCAVAELQRQHAHADQVAAVNPFVAGGDHGAYAQQEGAFGGPVAAAAGAIFGAGQNDQRRAAFGGTSSRRRRSSSARRSASDACTPPSVPGAS